jgi:glutaredoxin 3
MKEVKLYSTPGCPYCKRVKDFLKEKNIKFMDINLAADSDAADMIAEKTGQLGVPVTQIGDEFIVGDELDQIERSLK